MCNKVALITANTGVITAVATIVASRAIWRENAAADRRETRTGRR